LNGTIQAVARVYQLYPCFGLLIEDKANGPEVIKAIKKHCSSVIAVSPKTSKEERAQAANIHYAAHSVFHLEADWTPAKETHLQHFPKGAIRDDVDATSQAILYLAEQQIPDFAAAVAEGLKNREKTPWNQHFSIAS
jgi:predicted phage terminase large subunit-like protein